MHMLVDIQNVTLVLHNLTLSLSHSINFDRQKKGSKSTDLEITDITGF